VRERERESARASERASEREYAYVRISCYAYNAASKASSHWSTSYEKVVLQKEENLEIHPAHPAHPDLRHLNHRPSLLEAWQAELGPLLLARRQVEKGPTGLQQQPRSLLLKLAVMAAIRAHCVRKKERLTDTARGARWEAVMVA
jgi:hypothetical protein